MKLDIISKEKEENNNIILKIRCSLKDTALIDNLNIPPTEFESDDIREIKILKDMTKSASGDLNIKLDENELSFLFTFNYPEDEKKQDVTNKNGLTVKNDFFGSREKIQLKDANILLVEDDIMNGKVMTLNISKFVRFIAQYSLFSLFAGV